MTASRETRLILFSVGLTALVCCSIRLMWQREPGRTVGPVVQLNDWAEPHDLQTIDLRELSDNELRGLRLLLVLSIWQSFNGTTAPGGDFHPAAPAGQYSEANSGEAAIRA